MQSAYLATDDTIVALSTSYGIGAIAIIRLSGKRAIEICCSVFDGKDLRQAKSHSLHYGRIVHAGEIIDEVIVGVFRAPRSYTCEDVIEISCHGSLYVQQKIIEILIEKGARAALPGEFTFRAFLNGRLDLTQAEAVADLIASQSESAHKVAMQQMRGGFSATIKQLRERLIHFAALVELELDFAEEDVEFARRDELKRFVEELLQHVVRLMESFRLGNVIKNGVSTVIAGRPNAGKSTLLNTLLQEERAIVSEIPGTTRDVIEETVNINGILFRFIDTAGIREATDAIEKIGIERTLQKIQQSALVIYLFDITTATVDEVVEDIRKLQARPIPVIPVGNKIDLIDEQEKAFHRFRHMDDVLFISSKAEIHIDQLKEKLIEKITGSQIDFNAPIITNLRHYESLRESEKALREVLAGLDQARSEELLALDIRRALHALGAITGEIDIDRDILGTIFSRFCIGK